MLVIEENTELPLRQEERNLKVVPDTESIDDTVDSPGRVLDFFSNLVRSVPDVIPFYGFNRYLSKIRIPDYNPTFKDKAIAGGLALYNFEFFLYLKYLA